MSDARASDPQPGTMPGDDGNVIVINDPRVMRALAHPARITVIHHLFAGEVLTATECAQLAELTPSAMSYHLRALERWGLVVRAEASGDGRERPWRAAGSDICIQAGGSMAARTAQAALLEQLVGTLHRDLQSTAHRHSDRADGSYPQLGLSFSPAFMTEDEAVDLDRRVRDLMAPYTRRRRRPAGARRYHLWWAGLDVDPDR